MINRSHMHFHALRVSQSDMTHCMAFCMAFSSAKTSASVISLAGRAAGRAPSVIRLAGLLFSKPSPTAPDRTELR